MKNRNKILVFFIILASLILAYSSYLLISNVEVSESIRFKENEIRYVAGNSQTLLSEYFLDKKAEGVYYSNTNFVKSLLRNNVTSDKDAALREANRISDIKMRELENYLIFNRDLTLQDLKDSPGFREIVISRVGKNGYSGIIGEDATFIFHPNSELEGKFIGDYINANSFFELINKINETGEKDYTEYTLQGSNQSKIGVVDMSRLETSDGEKLYLFTSVVIDDFKTPSAMPSNSDFNLGKILNKNKDYINVSIVSNDGYILYGHPEYVGSNLVEKKPSLKVLFSEPKNVIMGPMYSLDRKILFLSFSPVYDSSDFLGYVIIRISSDYVYNLIDGSNLNNTVFLVNSNFYIASPYKNFSILSHQIIEEDTEECVAQLKGEVDFEEIFEYENVNGEKILRYHESINNPDLCIMSESFKEYQTESFKKIQNTKRIFSFSLLLISIFIIYFIIFKSKVKLFSDIKKKEKGILDYISKIDDFEFLMTSLIVILFLFFLLNYFLFIREIKDLFTAILGYSTLFLNIFIIKYALKYKNNKLLINSSLLILAMNIILIVLHHFEIYTNADISANIWAIPIAVLCISLIFLLNSFRSVKK